MSDARIPGPPRSTASKLLSAPSPLIWKVLIVAGILGRGSAEVQAVNARAAAEAAAARMAAAAARQADSLRLAAQVDSASGLPRLQALALDSVVHAAPYAIPHERLHERGVGVRLDSTARLLKRAANSAAMLALARQELAAARDPVGPEQARRLTELSQRATRLEQRLIDDSLRRESGARARAKARARAQERAEEELRSSGATAVCRDGTLSYSASRRGTCSHHGGVARWM